jgi:hypothetical protein
MGSELLKSRRLKIIKSDGYKSIINIKIWH